jgi:hypothetical protein
MAKRTKEDLARWRGTLAKKISKAAMKRIRNTVVFQPHELLRYWANGIEVAGFKPDPDQQIAAAIAAAPYYQPKLANVEIKSETHIKAVIAAQPLSVDQWAAKYLPGQSTSLLHQNKNTQSLTIDATPATPLETTPPVEVKTLPSGNPVKQNENPENADAPAANSKTESETV